jgi:hypothetical protein
MAETLDFLPDCSRWDSISLYLVLPGLWPYLYEVRTILVHCGGWWTSTMHPATILCSHAWMFSSLIVGMRYLGWLMCPGYDRWPHPGPICRTNDPWRSSNPASLLLHNISNRLGRHTYTYAGTPQQVSQLYRHIWIPAGIYLYPGLVDALIFWPGPSLVNRHKVNHSTGIFLVS